MPQGVLQLQVACADQCACIYELAGLLWGTGSFDLPPVFNTAWNQITKVCIWTGTNTFGVLGLACEEVIAMLS